MPDRDGRWTKAELERFATWRAEKIPGDLACPVCTRTVWTISPTCLVRVGVRQADGRTAIDTGRGHPEIVLVYTHCAGTQGFSAQTCGVL